MIETTFFRDLAYVFGAAVVGGGVAKALRQPLILGYVLGGFLIGPFTPGPTLSEVHQFEVLAELGVILLMYSIGLEFSFDELLQVKWVAIFGGPLGHIVFGGPGRGCGMVTGMEYHSGTSRRGDCLGRQHHGAFQTPGGSRRIALTPRPRNDRHNPDGGPRGRSAHRFASLTDQSHRRPLSRPWNCIWQGATDSDPRDVRSREAGS